MNVREIAELEREPTISPHFSSINSSAIVVAGTIAGLLSGFWMQLCVNDIAYHNLSLTSGSFVLVRFSLHLMEALQDALLLGMSTHSSTLLNLKRNKIGSDKVQ
jgi:hypothetical protein